MNIANGTVSSLFRHYALVRSALSFACAVSTRSFKIAITFSGSSAPKIAVPATMTLLPAILGVSHNDKRFQGMSLHVPASAQTSIVFGPTPPSTSMFWSGNRSRSSATLGTQRSRNF